MEDPDAPSIKPVIHWLMGDLPPVRTIPHDASKGDQPSFDVTDSFPISRLKNVDPTTVVSYRSSMMMGGVQGGNSQGTVGYYGPKPPVGDKPHRYVFTVYAPRSQAGPEAGLQPHRPPQS